MRERAVVAGMVILCCMLVSVPARTRLHSASKANEARGKQNAAEARARHLNVHIEGKD